MCKYIRFGARVQGYYRQVGVASHPHHNTALTKLAQKSCKSATLTFATMHHRAPYVNVLIVRDSHCGVVCILAAEIQFVYTYMYVAVRRVFHAHFDPQFLVKPVFIITIPAKPASCETHSKGHKGTMLSIPSESNTSSTQ